MSVPRTGIELRPEERRVESLIASVARGDSDALAALYDATGPSVLGLARRIVGDAASAEEVALEVYTQVWRQAHRYDAGRSTPTGWLLMLARSRAIDHLRSSTRHQAGREAPLDAAAQLPDSGPTPEEASSLAACRRTVQSALDSLPSEQRAVIELAYFGGLSHREIATQTGQPLGTVKTRVRLAMVRLRDLLQPMQEDHAR